MIRISLFDSMRLALLTGFISSGSVLLADYLSQKETKFPYPFILISYMLIFFAFCMIIIIFFEEHYQKKKKRKKVT